MRQNEPAFARRNRKVGQMLRCAARWTLVAFCSPGQDSDSRSSTWSRLIAPSWEKSHPKQVELPDTARAVALAPECSVRDPISRPELKLELSHAMILLHPDLCSTAIP